MRLKIPYSAAWGAAFVAVAARMFYALSVEGAVHNGAWISALLGGALAIPLLAIIDRMRRRNGTQGVLWTPLKALLCLAALADSGLVLSAIVRSSSFLATEDASSVGLLLPLLLTLFWCVTRNGNALGYGAMLWARIFPALLLPVALLQWRHYRPAWLLPMLGNGWRDILAGGMRCACCFVPVAALLLLDEDAPKGNRETPRPAVLLSCGAVLAAALTLLRLMMAPTPVGGAGWLSNLDTLLTNGRAPLYLQLPMIVLWYAGMLHLLTGEAFAAALLLQRLVPALDGRLCALLVTLAAAGISCFPLSQGIPQYVPLWLYLAATVLATFCALIHRKAKGGHRPCA